MWFEDSRILQKGAFDEEAAKEVPKGKLAIWHGWARVLSGNFDPSVAVSKLDRACLKVAMSDAFPSQHLLRCFRGVHSIPPLKSRKKSRWIEFRTTMLLQVKHFNNF